MLTPEQNTELKAKIGTLIDTYTEVVEPPPPPPPPPPDDTTPHPDDPTKHDEHVAAMSVTPVPGVTVIVKAGETFSLDREILELQPRAVPRDLANDPLDFSGGIVSHGTVSITGTAKLPKAVPVSPIKANDTTIEFAVPLDGWAVGDELLIPGDARGQTEHPTIADIDGLTVMLSAPAAFNHGDLYRGRGVSRTPAPPVCNMTRDAGVHGPEGVTNAERPHLMFMHSQKVSAKHASFKNLGRTDAAVIHTTPEVVDGQVINDENTIGRYSFHNHVRKGATWTTTPVIVEGCVGDDSPKHVFVNHGGFMIVRDSAITRWSGSALFTENGSEIGAFIGNVTAGSVPNPGVLHSPNSRPPQYPIPPATKITPEDHGFAEYGVWLQGGGVPVIGHYASDSQVGIEFFPLPIHDSGQLVGEEELSSFLGENLNPPEAYRFGRPLEPLQDVQSRIAEGDPSFPDANVSLVPGYFKGNRSVGCGVGLGLWATFATGGPTIVEDQECINCNIGLELIYNRHSTIRGARLILRDPSEGQGYTPSSSCLSVNIVSANIEISDLIGEGYDYCPLPFQGDNKLIRAHFDNRFGPSVSFPVGGSLTLEQITFGNSITALPDAPYNVPEARGKIILVNDARTDMPLSKSFEPYTLSLDGQEVIHNCRMPGFVPFPTAPAGWEHVAGKTNRQLFDEFGWWVGGKEISDVELVPHPQVFGGGTLP